MTKARRSQASQQIPTNRMTFGEHLKEMQVRFFTVLVIFLVSGLLTLPFFDTIVNIIIKPLGDTQKLVYLTPGGAFNFMIQSCLLVGAVFTLPAIIYNLYRFIMPAMKMNYWLTALRYTISSFFLAIVGILFSYYILLPAAIHFLTSFNLYHIDPMLTVDSYFSFVMTYIGVSALLFQIPLVILIINGVTPLKPSKLMSHQGKIILGSFIAAAIISPTPDALNQTILASPMVIMYQVGIILVWLKNREARKSEISSCLKNNRFSDMDLEPGIELEPSATMQTILPQTTGSLVVKDSPSNGFLIQKSIDGLIGSPQMKTEPCRDNLSLEIPERTVDTYNRPLLVRGRLRSVDGISIIR